MKHTLRYCFILLALATTGLFAQNVTAPVDTPAPTQQKSHKAVKKAHKKHRKAKKKKTE
jgi:hypothetical protein